MIKGTTIGAITDLDGQFSLSVPVDAKLIGFSFTGMKAQEFTLAGKSKFDVTMTEETIGIDEVVVVGYGVQKKASVVASIATTTEKELKQRGGVYNLAQAISGQMAGVTVQEMSGEPGRNDPSILIRGMSTWNGSQPLILVDGIERRMTDIDINEVDNVSVLKDASATAVYGTKGANGVILITTKRGLVGKAKLSMTASTGWEGLSKVNPIMDAYEAQGWRNAAVEHEVSANESSWAYMQPEAERLKYKSPQVSPYTYLYPNVAWQKVMLKDWAKNSRVNMNLNGGTDFAQYFASIGYTHEGDIFNSSYNTAKQYNPGYSYDRFNFRGNVDFKLTKTTTLSANISGYTGTRRSPASIFGGPATQYIIRGVYELAPDAFPAQYPDGTYGKDPTDPGTNNPYALLQEGGVTVANRRQIASDFKLVQKLDFVTKGLSFSANLSYDNYIVSTGPSVNDAGNNGQAKYSYINPNILNAKTRQDTLNAYWYYISANVTGYNDFDWYMKPWSTGAESVTSGSLERALVYQAGFDYARSFGKHDVTALALVKRRQNATGGSFPSYREDWVGRVTYNYNAKYMAEFNGAYNGSELFAQKYRFGFFPSMALGWNMNNENFMKQYTWIDKFKIRGSIGEVGNDAFGVRWPYIGSWTTGSAAQVYAVDPITGSPSMVNSPYASYREGNIPNFNIHWETAVKRNIGAEISVFNRLLTLDVDLFKETRKDIYIAPGSRSIPATFGAPPVGDNLGATQTQGYELELGLNKNYRTWGYWAKFIVSRATDKITKYEDPQLLPAYQKKVDYQINQNKSQLQTSYMNNWDDVYASAPGTSNMNWRLPGGLGYP